MAVRKKNLNEVEKLCLPGRDLRWLADAHTIGSEQLSVAIMTCPPFSVVKPLHSHGGVEEVLLVLEGQGEAWVDGETAAFHAGDAVLFPAGSRHQVRNTGSVNVVTASIFGCPSGRESYVVYDENVFETGKGGMDNDE